MCALGLGKDRRGGPGVVLPAVVGCPLAGRPPPPRRPGVRPQAAEGASPECRLPAAQGVWDLQLQLRKLSDQHCQQQQRQWCQAAACAACLRGPRLRCAAASADVALWRSRRRCCYCYYRHCSDCCRCRSWSWAGRRDQIRRALRQLWLATGAPVRWRGYWLPREESVAVAAAAALLSAWATACSGTAPTASCDGRVWPMSWETR